MDDRMKTFLDDLKLYLTGLPEAETKEALDYYEEYLNDALDEGKSMEDILSHLESPEKIAAMILAETSIRKAQSNPGLRNYSTVLKYARSGITKPFSALLFSLFIFVTYTTAVLLFCSAIVSVAAACVLLPGFVYEALRIPSKYMGEIIGTMAGGVFFTALFLLLAYGLFKLCRLLIQVSSGLVGQMLNKSRKSMTVGGESTEEKRKSSALPVNILITAAAVGLVISLATGLPEKMFMIFNSAVPSSIQTLEWEYDRAEVGKISITTAHSHIRIEKGHSDKVKITYEQPDWMEPEITFSNGQLTFSEKSNGRMPAFELVSMHENGTEVTVMLPEGFAPETFKLESKGGFVHIDSTDFNIKVKTYTGNIYLTPGTSDKPADIKAGTSAGIIQAGGINAGTKTANGLEYHVAAQNGSSIKLETSRGSIFLY